MAFNQGFGSDWHPDFTLNVDDQCLMSWLETDCLNYHRQQEPAYEPILSMDARAHADLPSDSMRVLENLPIPNEPQHASRADSDLPSSSSPSLNYGGHVQRSLHELSRSSRASTVAPGSSFMIHEYPEGHSASQSPTPQGGRPNRRQKKRAIGRSSQDHLNCQWQGCERKEPFCNKATLKRHRETQHISPGAYPCPEEGCGQIFNRKDNLLEHKRRLHDK